MTYGLGTAVTYTAKVVGTRGDGQPTGSVSFSGTPLTGSPVVVTIVAGDCTSTGTGGNRVYTCTVPSGAIVVPVLTPPAAYTVTATYSGSTTYGGAFGTVTETVVKQTPTLTAPTVVPNTVGQGTTGPVVLTTTFAWAGTGTAPTNAVTFTVDGATVGTATCVAAGTDTRTCTYSYNPSALTTGGHTVRAVYAGDGHYNGVTSGGTTLTVNPLVTPTLTLVVAPAGTTAVGIASGTLVTLTATLTVPTNAGAWNGTVTFIDATSGVTVGTTNVGTGTGVTTTATFQFTPTAANDATYPAGFNQFTATYNGGTYYHSVGPVNGNPAYIGGLLFSLTLAHNFSTDPGTVDGTPTTPYGIQVYNFTAAGVSGSLNFTNSNQGTNAFGYTTNCPVTIAAGATCEIVFTYLPPYGDGNSTTVGRYEAGSWSVTATGTILGVGIKGFASPPRAGVATFPAVLAGKALLPVGSLSVTPLSYTFGPLAPGAQSKTLQISVTNPNTTAVGVLYTLPTGAFTTVNNCPSTLNGNATCQIQVTFKSSTVGTQTASVTLNPAGGPAITVSLTGIVQSGTGLVMSTDNHGFGNIPRGPVGNAVWLEHQEQRGDGGDTELQPESRRHHAVQCSDGRMSGEPGGGSAVQRDCELYADGSGRGERCADGDEQPADHSGWNGHGAILGDGDVYRCGHDFGDLQREHVNAQLGEHSGCDDGVELWSAVDQQHGSSDHADAGHRLCEQQGLQLVGQQLRSEPGSERELRVDLHLHTDGDGNRDDDIRRLGERRRGAAL